MVVLGRNYNEEVLGLWFDNLDYSLALAIELLAIQKACLVSNNFIDKDIQEESDYKVVVEVLLEINVYP